MENPSPWPRRLRYRSHIRFDSKGRLIRRPLQSLPIAANGDVRVRRVRSIRRAPENDVENSCAITRARSHNSITLQERLVDMQEAFAALDAVRGLPVDDDDSSDGLDEDDFEDVSSDEDDGGLQNPADWLDEEDILDVPGDYEAADTSPEEGDDNPDDEQEHAPVLDPSTAGLKEISNLGKFTVSSHKQGNGVEELRSEDLKLYWQSDGPQPHKLTVYFVKRVGIRDIRFFVDYNEDESYTPTKIVFKSGTSENNLVDFAKLDLQTPVGWQQVPVAGAGGGHDGNTLVSYVFQMQILENHQNGKDTHLRGIRIFALDTDAAGGRDAGGNPVDEAVELMDDAAVQASPGRRAEWADRMVLAERRVARRVSLDDGGLTAPDFMREPEIR